MPEAKSVILALPSDPVIMAAIGEIAIRHGQLDNSLRADPESIES